MDFATLQKANKQRCEESFHEIDGWTPWDWSNAMAGEAGELAEEVLCLALALVSKSGKASNLTKKMARVWPSNRLIAKWDDKSLDQLREELGKELADVAIYADLLATRIGVRLEDCIRDKFNATSDKIGSKVKL
jgi:NTP pyrophosphatase (non-canonical NTP hydrolase)